MKTVHVIDFDPVLGWVQKKDRDNLVLGGLPLQLGPFRNRIHRQVENASGAPILAVGDSFTFGSEVGADESWPAQLEQLLGIRLINAGVGGYGIDQAVLWAERLVPQVRPRLLLFSFIQPGISRTGMSIFSGANKPFFREVHGTLEAQNLPLEPYTPSTRFAGMKAIVGYSKLADWTAQRLGARNAWRASTYEYKYEDVDYVETSCAFMTRLAKIGVPAVAIGQHGWNDFIPDGATNVDQVKKILECARQAGIPALDTWAPIRERLGNGSEPPDFKKYYVNGIGHMTGVGNAIVAEQIAKFISENGIAASKR